MELPHMYIMCNAEYEPVRYQFLVGHLKRMKIPDEKIHWVTSIWGKDLTSEQVFEVYDPFRPRFGIVHNLSYQSHALSRGEVSVVLTFREAMRQILRDGHDNAIIFESDIMLRYDFKERLAQVLKGCYEEFPDWDYVSLGEGVFTRPPNNNPSYFSEQKLYSPPHKWVFRCCDSMLLRRKFLEKVSQTLVPFRECLDWEMNVQINIHGGLALWADPPIVEPGTARSRYGSSLPA